MESCWFWLDIYVPQASENLGMAMVYTLVTSVQEWLSERFGQDANVENSEEEETEKDDVWPYVLPIISTALWL